MGHRKNWPKRLLAGLLSTAMLTLNITTAMPAFAAPSAEAFREDAELVNDLALPKETQRRLQREVGGTDGASPSDASESSADAEVGELPAGSVRWGTPSDAQQILHTNLDGVEIEVTAPTGVLPEGATLRARHLTEEEEKEVLAKIAEHADTEGKTATAQFLCDLSVLNAAGEEIQPDSSKGALAVSFRNVSIVSAETSDMNTDAEETESKGVSVLHIDEDEKKVETLEEGLDEELPILQASAESFSPFAVVNYQSGTSPLGIDFKLLDYDGDTSRTSYKLKDVTVKDTAGRGITSINFEVDDGSIDTLPETGTAAAGKTFRTITDILPAHKFYQIIFSTPLTTAETKAFIENNLKFKLTATGASQQLKINLGNGTNNLPPASNTTLTKRIIPNPVSGDSAEHYYMYVSRGSAISWAESYNLAKSYYLEGMRGYLVTITSRVEDEALDHLTTQPAWSGGARFVGINDAASVPQWYNNRAPRRGVFSNQNVSGASGALANRTYRWQNGPETNLEYTRQGYGTLNLAYNNWNPGEPNSARTFLDGYESCMQVHDGSRWNDMWNLHSSVTGFFVEFSRYNQTGQTNSNPVPVDTNHKVSAVSGGQTYYFNNLDNAMAWSQQNGNAPLTLLDDLTLTQDIPAGVSINPDGHTLTVPSGANVVNNGTIDLTNPSSQLQVQGSNGNLSNAGNGQITRKLTVRMKDRHVTAGDTLTWALTDALITGNLIGNDRVSAIHVDFDNSSTAAEHPTLPVTASDPTSFDNGTNGSRALGTYIITYLPGTVTRDPHRYTVKFAANAPAGRTASGSMPDRTVMGGVNVDLTNLFSVDGFDFAGWTASDGKTYGNGATPKDLTKTNNGVITLTANWTPKNYTIQYTTNVNPSSRTAAQAVNPNTATSYRVSDPNMTLAPMTWPGYTFGGWYENAALSGTPVAQLITSSIPAGNKHYYAKWTPKNYTLTYQLNDTSGTAAVNPNAGFTSYTVETANHTLAAPTRTGYNFLGWYRDAGLTTPAPAVIDTTQGDSNPTRVYAKWSTPLQYSITYYMNDSAGQRASNPASNPGSFNVTSPNINFANPTRRGYTFQGWYTNPGLTTAISGINTSSPANMHNFVLYAKWSSANSYTVRYHLNDSTPAGHLANNPNTLTNYTVLDSDTALRPATRTGYNFLGWYDNPGFTGSPVSTIRTADAANKDFYAKWDTTPISYPIRYHLNDSTPAGHPASNPAANLTSYTVLTNGSGTINVLPALRNGYTFLGWYDNAALTGTPISSFSAMDATPKNFYAKWSAPKSYTVQYSLNDAAPAGHPAVNPNTVTSYTVLDSNVTLAPATRTGYDFEGWYDNAAFSGSPITGFSASDAANKHYYAKWSAAKSYTVNWHLNDSTPAGHPATNPNTVASYTVLDSDVTIQPATRTGFSFLGWYDNPGFTGTPVTTLRTMDAANKNYYAKWDATPISYPINYVLNDGSPAGHAASNPVANLTSYTVLTNSGGNISLLPALRNGYTFLGWYDNASFTGSPISTFPASDAAAKTFYAKWSSANSYTVNYTLNDATPAGHPATNPNTVTSYTVLDANVTLVPATRNGYDFEGWYDNAAFTGTPITGFSTSDATNKHYYAKWSAAKNYTVQWHLNDSAPAGHPASNPNTVTSYNVLDADLALQPATRTGYDFLGWYDNAALSGSPITTLRTADAADKQYYAKWSAAKTYTVQWNLNDSAPAGHPASNPNTVASYSVLDSDITVSPATRPGYTFLGWYDNPGLTGTPITTLRTMDAENKSYYAKWDTTPITYPINYVLNDGTPTGHPATNPAANLTSYTVLTNGGGNISVLPALRNGYTFGGWYDNPSFSGSPINSFSAMDAAPKTFYAKWSSANSYTVTYTLNDGTPAGHPATNPNTVSTYTVLDSNVTLQPATRTGYDFAGWYDNPGFSGTPITGFNTADAENKHYYAKWSAVKNYNVQYHLNDSTPAGHPASNPNTVTSYTVLDADVALRPATRTGYDFEGWYDNAALTGTPVTNLHTMDAENKQYYAKWSAAKNYTVQWELNDSVPAGHPATNPNTVTTYTVLDADVAIQPATRTGYSFLGWYADPAFTGSPVTNLHTMDAENKHYYARWSTPDSYSVTYHLNDATPAGHPATNPNTKLSYSVTDADFAIVPATRTGYTFEGWYDNPSFTGTSITSLHTMDAENKNYYAKWSAAQSYPINYVLNDSTSHPATNPAVNLASYTVETLPNPIAVANPLRTGYSFQGWYDNPGFTGATISSFTAMDAAPKTFYAKWSAPLSYTVQYTLNDGTPAGHPATNPNTVTSYTVVDPNVTLSSATRPGYDFLGWYENPALTGTPVTGFAVSDAENKHYYAKWSAAKNYSVQWNLNDATPAGHPATNPNTVSNYTVEDAEITIHPATRTGYSFLGWYDNASLTGTPVTSLRTMDAENKQYYAKWSSTPISYPIVYTLNDGSPAGHPASNPAANLTSYTVLTNGSGNISLLPASRNGYTFEGWYDNAAFSGSPITGFPAMDAEAKHYYAKWSAANSYTVAYTLNDDTPTGHPATNPNTVISYTVLDSNVTLAPATRTGYDFEGWYENPAFTGSPVTGFPVSDAANKHFYAKWSAAKNYTVQWNLNDATPAGHPATNPNTVSNYTVEDADITISPATRTGYGFLGWYDNASLTGSPVTSIRTMDAENKQYYAKWSSTPISYPIVYTLNDVSPAGHPATNPAANLTSYTVLTNGSGNISLSPASRNGYTFEGWYDNASFTGAPITGFSAMDAEAKHYYAKWSAANTYTVAYTMNDGTPAGHPATNPNTVTSYSVLDPNVTLAPATRTGYDFAGWYENPAFTGSPVTSFSTSDAANKHFYAKWSAAKSYTVQWSLNDGTPAGHTATNPNTVTSYTVLDADVTVQPATRTGYDFLGWYDNAALTGTPVTTLRTMDAENKHYYAKWSAAKNYTVQWNLNDGAPAGHPASNPNTVTSYTVLDADVTIQPATRTGYTFLGWYDNAGFTGTPVTNLHTMDAENKQYFAKWDSTPISYPINYVLNDGTPAGHPASNPVANLTSYTVLTNGSGTVHLLPALRSGYSFLGWYDNPAFSGSPISSFSAMDAEAKTYYAKWSSANNYSVSYTLNDVTPAGHPATNPNTVTSYTVLDPNVTLAPATRTGYDFEGWYDNPAFTGTAVIGFPVSDAADKHYYAKWSAPKSYTVQWNLNDGTPAGHPATNPNTVLSYTVLDADVTIRPATRTGYDFEGWYDNPGLTGTPVTNLHTMDAENKQYYAKWSAAKSYTVQWHLNDATPAGHPASNPNTVASYTVQDADVTIQPATRTGYTFLGWYDNVGFAGVPVTTLRTMDAEDKAYYAKWDTTPNSYPINYVLNDGSPAGHPATNPGTNLTSYTVLTNGGGSIALQPASRNGYTFLGWYDNASFAGTPITDFPAMDAAAKTFYAKWSSADTYTVAYTLNDGTPAGHTATNPNTVTSYTVLDSNVILAPATRTGYDFEGWYDSPGFTGTPITGFPTSDAENKHYYAKWSVAKSYTVQWNLNDNTPAGHPANNPNTVASYTVLDADVTIHPATRTGYTFLGWYDNTGFTGTPVTTLHTMDAENKQYFAKWDSTPISYPINYVLNDGSPAGHPATNPAANLTSYTVLTNGSGNISLLPALRNGYTFEGWYDNAAFSGTPISGFPAMDAAPKTFYAKWSSANNYSVTYTLNDVTPAGHPATNPNTVTSYTVLDPNVTLAPATRTGYDFEGWYDNSGFTGAPITGFSSSDAENKHYYAKWSAVKSYNVQYHLNDSTPAGHPASNPNTVTSYTVLDADVALRPATRTGYDFEGWYDNAALTGTPVTNLHTMDAENKQYYAKWSAAKNYTVQWELNDSAPAGHPATNPNTVTTYTVLDADVTIQPATRTGYNFLGWYADPAFTGSPVTNLHTMDAENKHYYARWSTPDSYSVTYHLNDATPAGHPATNPNTKLSYSVTDADFAIVPATRTGYTFEGWYDNPGFTGAPITSLHTMDAANKNYYAKWSAAQSYPINFVLNDSASHPATNPTVNLTSYTVETLPSPIAVANPLRTGYNFLGWYDNPGFTGTAISSFPAMDAAAKTFYAKWSAPLSYTVQYTLNDGTPAGHPATNPNTVTSYTVLDPNVTLAPATRTGYDFEGWYDNPGFTGTPITGFPTNDAADKHYYAKWSAAKTYTVQWHLNDSAPAGHAATNPNTVASYTVEDADITVHPATRTGYTFEGWYDNPGFTGTPVTTLHTMDAENKNYYAKWSAAPNSYPVNYVLNDGTPAGHPATNPAANLTSYTVLTNGGGNINLLPASRNGYTFEGWYDNAAFSGAPITSFPAMDAAAKTFYAKWSAPNNYTVTYSLNDGTPAGHPATNPNTVTSYTVLDPNVTLAPATRTGYDFDGWYDNAAFSGTPITGFPASDAANKHFYAKWSAPKSYTVNWNLNDGTPAGHPATNPNTVTSYTVTDADMAIQPATRTGYDFLGWYDNAALTGSPVTNIHTMDAENKQYFAKWSPAKSYTVQWNLNDSAPAGHPATNPNTVATYTVEDADVAINPATRTGFTFLGWYDNAALTGTPVTNLHTMDAENKQYFAKWDSTPISYPINYMLNDGTPTGTTATNPAANLTSYTVLTNGSGNISLLPALRNGYTFEGWYDNAAFSGTPITGFPAMDAAPKTFYAKWSSANNYSVTYTLNDVTPAGHPANNPNTVTSYTVLDPNVTLAPATRTGYDFEGWYDNAALSGTPKTGFNTADAENKLYYAKWSAVKSYNVQYHLNDSTPAGHPASNPNTVTSYTVLDADVALRPATRTGYDFEGWYDNAALSGTPITGFPVSDAADKHFYAKWSAPKSYTVNWNLNDGTPAGHPATNPNTVTSYTVTDADMAIQPATRTGYDFLGWYDNAALTGSPVTNIHTMDAENKQYFAKWSPAKSYTVQWNLNDNTPAGHPANNPNTVASYTVLDADVTIHPATRTGYTFLGWYDNTGFTGTPVTTLHTMDAENKHYFAKWDSTPISYPINYVLNDGSPAGHPATNPAANLTSYTVLTNGSGNINLLPALRNGYTFEGWYDNAAFTGAPISSFPVMDAAPKTFYAKWSSANNYSVTYTLNDVTPPGHPATNPNTVTSYTVLDPNVTLAPATRTGYDFEGWYDNPGFSGAPITGFPTGDAADKHYYAKWSAAKSYTVQWNLNDSAPAGHAATNPNTVASYTVEDADITVHPATRTGYTFEGWYDNPGFTGTPVTTLHTMDAENKNYYAKWSAAPNSYPIHYMLNDSTPAGHPANNPAANLTSYTVLTNGSGNINLSPASRNGYTFEGWYDNAAFSGAPITSFPAMDAAAKTFYAKWSAPNNYAVAYTLNDGTPTGHPATNPNTVTSYTVLDPNVTLVPATRTGYDFEGWYDNAAFSGTPIAGFPVSDAVNKHFYAKWSAPKNYTVNWNLNDGTPAGHPATNPNTVTSYTVTDADVTIQPATRTGYDFLGWYDNAALTGSPVTNLHTMDAENKQYYAKWSPAKSFAVQWNLNDSAPAGHPASNPNTVATYTVEDADVAINPATRTGFTFLGWYDNAALTGSPVTNLHTMDAENKQYYAKWDSTPISYPISYQLNDGTPAGHPANNPAANPTNYDVLTNGGGNINLLPPSRNGFTFDGWYDNPAFSGTAITSFPATDASPKQFYAKWSAPLSYTVSYDLNDGTPAGHPASNPNTVTSYTVLDPNVTLAPATRTGYDFEGWYDNPAFTGTPVTGFPTGDASNKRFYAKWSAPKTYTVNWNLNDGTPVGHPASNPNTVTSYTVLDADVALQPATRTGYDFEGWYDNAALTGTPVTSLHTMDAENKQYYAKWSAPKTYAVNWDLNDGTPAGHPASNPNAVSSYTVLDPDLTLAPATRAGYTFLGWFDNAALSGTAITTLHSMDATDRHYYARWGSPNSYQIYYHANDTAANPATNPNTVTSYTVLSSDFTLATPTRPGYTFEGWFDDAALTHPVTGLRVRDLEDKHFYMKWSQPSVYPISYVLNDRPASLASTVGPMSYTVEDADFALTVPTRNGATFLGWYDNAAFTGTPITTLHTHDAEPKTYYAKWSLTSYSMSYDLNPGGGIGAPTSPAGSIPSFTVEDEINLNPPVRRGYTGTWLLNGQPVTRIPEGTTGNLHLTAGWTVNHYGIRFETGETGNSPIQGLSNLPTSYTIEDAAITLPTPSRPGYTFVRWEKSSAPGVAVNSIPAESDGDVTLRAVWEPIRYRITYDTVGGINNSQNPTSFTIEDEVTLFGTVKEGVRFWTWQQIGGKFINTIPAGTTHDIALVARYQKDQDTDNVGGSGGGAGGGGTHTGKNGSGSGQKTGAGTEGQAPSATNGAEEPGTAVQQTSELEPIPQQFAGQTEENRLAPSSSGKKIFPTRGKTSNGKTRRLPKTGEAAATDGLRSSTLGLLPADIAVRRKREEQ